MTEDFTNVQNEIQFIGCLYQDPNLYLQFERFINSKYYFTDPVTKFFYDEGFIVYKNRTQNFNETNINLYMSENEDRFKTYKEHGGYATIEGFIAMSELDNAQTYFDILQKYALLREYERRLKPERILKSKNFDSLKPKHVHYNVINMVQNIYTKITGDPEVENLSGKVRTMVTDLLEKPAMGMPTPFPSFNELFRGLRKGTAMGVGMTSNSGKTRFMIRMIADLAFIQKETCLVMLNEMSVEDIRMALLTTVINNDEFQQLTGVKIKKNERELALGIYLDRNKEPIYRKMDETTGKYLESLDEFIDRLKKISIDYNEVCFVADWIDKQIDAYIYVIDVSLGYTDNDLETHIKKTFQTKGIEYYFYDTLKNELGTIGEWAALKQTATKLAELAKNLNVFIYGSLQLTDDVNMIDPLDLNSMNIAASKGLKTVLTTLTLWKEIDRRHYGKYLYIPIDQNDGWGVPDNPQPLPESKDPNNRLYSCVVDKNRSGAKKKILFGVNLNTNKWIEFGELIRK